MRHIPQHLAAGNCVSEDPSTAAGGLRCPKDGVEEQLAENWIIEVFGGMAHLEVYDSAFVLLLYPGCAVLHVGYPVAVVGALESEQHRFDAAVREFVIHVELGVLHLKGRVLLLHARLIRRLVCNLPRPSDVVGRDVVFGIDVDNHHIHGVSPGITAAGSRRIPRLCGIVEPDA